MTKRKWVVTSAWPYVNAIPHLGNLIGSVLSADVFARYVRSKGDDVVFVSGSDDHGTPSLVSAIDEKITPEALTERNHNKIKQLFERWEISYDNYTRTHNPIHMKFTQDFYTTIFNHGYITTKEEEAFYCANEKLFLPDRFIEGTCPHCDSELARGDQCDKCGKLLDPFELIKPHCRICKKPPIKQKTKHWYMEFPKLTKELEDFVKNNPHIPDNARDSSLNNIKEGIPSRAITRDLQWGIPATFTHTEHKVIYVWFEAVLGYISAVKQWAEEIIKNPSKFNDFWHDPATRTVYFIGKDNIIFHLIIFPGLLIAYNKTLPVSNQFVLPYNVSSTEFLMFENQKFSKSRKIGIWIDEALELAPLEYWRYTLLRNRPEKSDSNFLWSTFEHDILELNDIIGNFIHRALSFIEKQYNGIVPGPLEEKLLDADDLRLIKCIKEYPPKIGDLLEHFEIKDALNEIISLAREGNIYINNKAPWKLFKQDKIKAGNTFYYAIQLVRTLGILLTPYIPNIANKIFEALGTNELITDLLWDTASDFKINAGHKIPPAKPLFQKLEIKDIQQKLDLLHNKTPVVVNKLPSNEIDYAFFKQFQFKVGTILTAEPIKDTKLLKLSVDLGESSPRQIVGGIGGFYSPQDLINTQVIVLSNLEPKEIHGVVSNGMLLAADAKKKGLAILRPDKNIPNGSPIL